jgi:hypothetical protein
VTGEITERKLLVLLLTWRSTAVKLQVMMTTSSALLRKYYYLKAQYSTVKLQVFIDLTLNSVCASVLTWRSTAVKLQEYY